MRKTRTLGQILVLAGALLTGLIIYKVIDHPGFPTKKWTDYRNRNNAASALCSELSKGSDRISLLDDLLENHLLRGMNLRKIFVLLGHPDNVKHASRHELEWVYEIDRTCSDNGHFQLYKTLHLYLEMPSGAPDAHTRLVSFEVYTFNRETAR